MNRHTHTVLVLVGEDWVPADSGGGEPAENPNRLTWWKEQGAEMVARYLIHLGYAVRVVRKEEE